MADLTVESLMATMRDLEAIKPEPYYDEMLGRPVDLIVLRGMRHELFRPITALRIIPFRVIEDDNVPAGHILFRGQNQDCHYIGVLDIGTGKLSQWSFRMEPECKMPEWHQVRMASLRGTGPRDGREELK